MDKRQIGILFPVFSAIQSSATEGKGAGDFRCQAE